MRRAARARPILIDVGGRKVRRKLILLAQPVQPRASVASAAIGTTSMVYPWADDLISGVSRLGEVLNEAA